MVQPAISFPSSPNLKSVFVLSVESKPKIPYLFAPILLTPPKLPTCSISEASAEPVLNDSFFA